MCCLKIAQPQPSILVGDHPTQFLQYISFTVNACMHDRFPVQFPKPTGLQRDSGSGRLSFGFVCNYIVDRQHFMTFHFLLPQTLKYRGHLFFFA